MDSWTILSGVLVLLGAAFTAGVIFERLGQSAELGYLLAGLLLGPNALGLASGQQGAVAGLAELGVALLLFAIGLEFSLKRLWRLGRVGLLGGTTQVAVTVAVAAVIAWCFGLRAQAAIGIGAIIAFSSTACVLRVLTDRGQIDSMHGRNALGILLLQDIAVIPLVLIISMLGQQGAVSVPDLLTGMGRSIGQFVGMTIGFWLIANFVLPRALSTSALLGSRELLILLAALLSLGSAWSAHAIGISPAIGAFVAGMVMAESPYAMQARADIGPLRTVFVTLFFVSIGMLGDPRWMADNWSAVMIAGTLVIGGKTLIAAGVIRLFRVPWPEAVATAICLGQIGEFSFIVAQQVFLSGTGPNDRWLFDLVVSVSIVSLLLTPYLVRLAPVLGRLFTPHRHRQPHHHPDADPAHAGPGVLVVGYGIAGQQLVEPLVRHEVPLTIVDFQQANIQLARDRGFSAVMGDARNRELLEHLHIGHALAVVVALPDHHTVIAVIHQVRGIAPGIPVIARARYHRYVGEIIAAGATVVVDEEQQIGRRLGLETRRLLRTNDESMQRGDVDHEEAHTRSWHRPPIHLATPTATPAIPASPPTEPPP